MSDLEQSPSADGADPGATRSEAAPMPFFPAPPARHTTPPTGVALSGGPPSAGSSAVGSSAVGTLAPPMAPPQVSQVSGRHQRAVRPLPAPTEPETAPPAGNAQPGTAAVVKGRITIEDEVVEKIAALAALEVDGVASLSERIQGVRVHTRDNEVALDLTIVVEYGTVIMDVAKLVKTNVARVTSLMLGMRVTAVNVVIDDVRMPGQGVGRRG
ncbi:Asp23/Gls24 family envelope stress response protein [Thermomonospora umbrina]|uniref:Putative alkaline shock family protein YloU n=1 Tax=Thermomonospora umbrina TaxID=111806 RepID=A0A3D9SFK7_9ACTN|nr:Asp23/Gls24 family envelope stress response protein [Thermomonospora umbrina]REE94696.1 putative alkaline shock family protein YloU [Thermomonospora umbrina]